MRALFTSLILLAAVPALCAPARIAVLEFQNPAGLTEQEVVYITELARGAAARLPAAKYFVMTRENILEQLPPGTTLDECVGECEVETGRKVGADFVLTGEVIRFGASLRVLMKLHDTKTGRLLGNERASGPKVDALERPVEQAAWRLFAWLGGAATRGAASTTPAPVELPSGDPYAAIGTAAAEEEALRTRLAEIERQKAAARAERKRHEATARAERKRVFDAAVEAEWRDKVRPLAERGDQHGARALEVFLKRWEGKEFPNARADEVRALLAKAKGGASSLEWIRIEGGAFKMGSANGYPDEGPVRRVRVPTFWMSRSAVTVAQYRVCVQAGACGIRGLTKRDTCNWEKAGRESHPISCVTWAQAAAFATWAGGSLPSEAQWEYAARSGVEEWTYPWGNQLPTCARAVMYDGRWGCGRNSSWPVCSKPNGNTKQGLCDMAGNVMEWVADWHLGGYAEAPTDGSASTGVGQYRVVRGGTWGSNARDLRAACRGRFHPITAGGNLGFRVARSGP